MLLRSFKLLTAAWLTLLLLVACGGGSAAPAATGMTARATAESTVTVSWDMAPGVEYWLFYGPTSAAPVSTTDMNAWIRQFGSAKINVTSPYVLTGLVNGTSYSFSVNGRTEGGPGGPGATPALATPLLAGTNWSAGTAAGGKDLRSVMLGSTYVAAGGSGALYSSPDGSTWSAITTYATSANLNGASFFGTYKLVGDAGLVLVSSDAVTWAAQTSGTSQHLYAIASNNVNLTVAVGANGTIITSPDGLTWTTRTSNTTQSLYGVTYSAYNVGSNTGGTWVAVGAANTLLESPDGLTWTSVTLPASLADLHGITSGASAFVAVGSSGTVLSSVNGVTWTSRLAPAAIDLKAVTYGTQFVAVGAGGNIFISTDGSTWTASAATGTSNDLNAVVRGTSVYVSVGAAGTNLLAK